MVALAALLPCQANEVPDVQVHGIQDDSRFIEAGDLFVAVAGAASDGADHVVDAVRQGAVAVLAERPLMASVPVVVVPELKQRRSEIASRFYDEPSSELRCVGVTGTNGKTSVACYLADMLGTLGARAGYIGTIGWGELGSLAGAELTTASAISTQQRLAHLRARGAQWIAMEVSSHALDQDRVAAVRFDVAVFTNLSRDHLDYHADFRSYGEAKARLFEAVSTAVINSDDEFGCQLAAGLEHARVVTCGISGDVSWRNLEFVESGVRGVWETPWGSAPFELPLVGEFSVANMSAAVAVLGTCGFDLARVVAAARQVAPVPGRVEFFRGEPNAVVDFAHTPDALDKVLRALRPHVRGQLVCVFGCGGDRDTGKRPQMARVAEQLADVLWLTSDNPRSEDPAEIIRQMRAGLAGDRQTYESVSRQDAIEQALRGAGANDLVLVAGKGHEDYQEIAGRRLPFSDRDVVRQLLAVRSSAGEGG